MMKITLFYTITTIISIGLCQNILVNEPKNINEEQTYFVPNNNQHYVQNRPIVKYSSVPVVQYYRPVPVHTSGFIPTAYGHGHGQYSPVVVVGRQQYVRNYNHVPAVIYPTGYNKNVVAVQTPNLRSNILYPINQYAATTKQENVDPKYTLVNYVDGKTK